MEFWPAHKGYTIPDEGKTAVLCGRYARVDFRPFRRAHQPGVLRDSRVCTRTVDRVAFFVFTAVLEQLTFCVDRNRGKPMLGITQE